MSGFAVHPLGSSQAQPTPRGGIRVPERTWEFDGGWGWVYFAQGHDQVQQPIILSDGFHPGETDRNGLYLGLNDPGSYPLVNELNQRGYDVVILGYRDCTASIYDNANVAAQCIMRTSAESVTDTPLVVGGFSMGGLIMRYALVKLEMMRADHRTSHYFSFDTPHQGAWIPISLQSFAYYIKPLYSGLADMIDSPAARQMLWRHKENLAADPVEHPDRTEFLQRLRRMGDWPMRPVKIGVANGRGDGQGNGNPPGTAAFKVTDGLYIGTELYLQAGGDNKTVAKLCTLNLPTYKRTSGYPELDSAAGGTLDSFGIAAETFNALTGQGAEAPYPIINFVPTISALAVTDVDLGSQQDLQLNVDQLDASRFALDACKTSSDNTGHTEITSELCQWLVDQLPAK
ncbi:hypothetical protein QMK19_37265 [Streptomyces sp. H10-C2]|uniref:esterase/lipase family protein n=1 Tax=unclassified Streptomyces TaxID=2593676 RepID=UPI0024BAA0D9|nr:MULTISPECIES: hypothetical protein [unclassified Streptomyces]MDJ0347311.1 hypothetical protein [Streptomyces sp. PH10-H1]MDJ0375108.1 hypothetical protein [Streptomyces sp. H10-C2]